MQQRYWIKKTNQDLSSKAFQCLNWVLIERGSLVILDVLRRTRRTKKYSAIENSFLLKVEDTHNFMSNFVTPSKRQCV